MILPLQISFRNMKPSEAVEARLREEVSKPETFYQKIMHCRVVVELPHKHRRKGISTPHTLKSRFDNFADRR